MANKNSNVVGNVFTTRHGGSKTKLYYIWASMNDRCSRQKCPRYKDYGGRGIAVCSEWRHDFVAFRDWAVANGYVEGLTIERCNNDLGYSIENCKWITRGDQNKNTRNTRFLVIFGERKSMVEWSEDPRCVVDHQRINVRLFQGWDAERAITTPARAIAKRQERIVTYQGRTLPLNAWAKILKVNPRMLYARAERGLKGEHILTSADGHLPSF